MLNGIPPHVAIRLKQLFPRISKSQTSDFRFPNDEINCAELDWFMQRYPFSITDSDQRKLNKGRKAFEFTQAELERILTPNYIATTLIGLKPGREIRHYQSQAIEIVKRRKSLLLGDDLGLGKTYTAAGMMLMSEARPAAVVVETHLQNQWEEKLTDFTDLRVHKITGTRPYNLPEADVYIFKYSQLLGWIDFFKLNFFKSATFDEIQQLRTGSESGKGSAALVLSESVDYCLGLSATPIYNYGSEIWNILKCIDKNVLGSNHEFTREWTDGSGRVSDPDALGTYLREQHVFLRRTKRDVGQQMPQVNRIIEIVESDQKALDDIADLARALAIKVTTGTFMERGQAAMELDMLARKATGVGKARAVAAFVRILLESNVPVLLLGWHREVYGIWLKELADFNPMMYTGTESPKQKEQSKKGFLSGDSNLLIMSLRSGAGVDGLQFRCSTVVFGELDWSPKVHEQVIGRLDREGQEDQVTAIYLNSDDGSDPPMVDILGLKASQSSGIVDPGRVFEITVHDDSRIKALARQFLDKGTLRDLDRKQHQQDSLFAA